MASLPDIAVRLLLVVFSIASFAPQVKRIQDRGDCAGISVYYVLYNCIIATYNFALILFAAINREHDNFFMPEKPGIGDWLNFAQFTVAWLGQLFLLYLELRLPPTRPGQTRFAVLAYLSFLAISLLPVIGEAMIKFDSDSDREWYGVLFIAPILYLVGPMMQILGLAAFRSQVPEIRSRDSSAADSALSLRGLVVQAVVFLLVGTSFLWRMGVPSEDLDEHFVVNLRMWYWTFGWATINNVIFAVAQGALAWIAWRHEDVEGIIDERSNLLE